MPAITWAMPAASSRPIYESFRKTRGRVMVRSAEERKSAFHRCGEHSSFATPNGWS